MRIYKIIDKLLGFLFFISFKNYYFRYLLHKIYFLFFKIKIFKLPNKLIYDLNRYPPSFGDYIHVLSVAQSLCLKFNNKNLRKIIIIYDEKNLSHKKFLKDIAFIVKDILDHDIEIINFSNTELKEKPINLGFSIYPYLPTFYFYDSAFRNHKPVDILVLSKNLDLRIFSNVSIRKFKSKKYIKIFNDLENLIKTKYYCFVMREEETPSLDKTENFNNLLKKYWDPNKSLKIIEELISEGKNVLIINPLYQKYFLPGAIYFEDATTDLLLRYFLYINAYQVLSVECGPAALLKHSNVTRYVIYDKANISDSYDMNYLKKNHYPINEDYIFKSPNRMVKIDNLEKGDILD